MIEISKILYKLLNVSSLSSLLTGGIYREQRPLNSTKNDIIIRGSWLRGDYFNGVKNGKAEVILITNKISDMPDTSIIENITTEIYSILNNSKNFQNVNNFYFEIDEENKHNNFDGQQIYCSNYIKLDIHKF